MTDFEASELLRLKALLAEVLKEDEELSQYGGDRLPTHLTQRIEAEFECPTCHRPDTREWVNRTA